MATSVLDFKVLGKFSVLYCTHVPVNPLIFSSTVAQFIEGRCKNHSIGGPGTLYFSIYFRVFWVILTGSIFICNILVHRCGFESVGFKKKKPFK